MKGDTFDISQVGENPATFVESHLVCRSSIIRLIWHFDLKKFTPGQQNRVKISLAAVTAFAVIAWPLIIAKAGVLGWVKFWLLPWLGFHFWVRPLTNVAVLFASFFLDQLFPVGRFNKQFDTS